MACSVSRSTWSLGAETGGRFAPRCAGFQYSSHAACHARFLWKTNSTSSSSAPAMQAPKPRSRQLAPWRSSRSHNQRARKHRPDVVQPRDRRRCEGYSRSRSRRARRNHGARDGHGHAAVPHAQPRQRRCRVGAARAMRPRDVSAGRSHACSSNTASLRCIQGTVARLILDDATRASMASRRSRAGVSGRGRL